MSQISNRAVLISAKHSGTMVVAALSANDTTRGNGVLVASGTRCILPPTMANVFAAFMSKDGAHYVAKEHGVRFMLAGNSPCFVERSGIASATLYVWRGGEDRCASIIARMVAKGAPADGWTVRTIAKAPKTAYLGLPTLDMAQAQAVVDVLCGPDMSSAGGGAGYVSDARLGTLLESVEFATPTTVPQAEDGTSAVASASSDASAKPGKGKGKGAKGRAIATVQGKPEVTPIDAPALDVEGQG